jgi:hypothetical protein
MMSWPEITGSKANQEEMDTILDEIKSFCIQLAKIANHIEIPRSEQTLIISAFKV